MIIDNQLLDTLSAQAKASPRLRQAYDLRNPSTSSGQVQSEDNSQRMLNALEPGTVMPIHRYRKSSESICMVRGKMIMRLYDDNGNVTDEFVMTPLLNSLNDLNSSTLQLLQSLWFRLRLASGIRWRCWKKIILGRAFILSLSKEGEGWEV